MCKVNPASSRRRSSCARALMFSRVCRSSPSCSAGSAAGRPSPCSAAPSLAPGRGHGAVETQDRAASGRRHHRRDPGARRRSRRPGADAVQARQDVSPGQRFASGRPHRPHACARGEADRRAAGTRADRLSGGPGKRRPLVDHQRRGCRLPDARAGAERQGRHHEAAHRAI